VGLGQVKLAEGDIAGAIDKLEAAARQGDDVTARLALGTARLRQGKHAEAARELRRVLSTDPRNVDALSGLGEEDGERRRRFYKLTADGRRVLAAQRSHWQEFVDAMRSITGVTHA
jgi:tetratricopeptide (TPR) repeat protein